jgi:hypothetical protein
LNQCRFDEQWFLFTGRWPDPHLHTNISDVHTNISDVQKMFIQTFQMYKHFGCTRPKKFSRPNPGSLFMVRIIDIEGEVIVG